MALPPPPKDDPVDEEWMTTYSDAITLIMAFFILFFSFSRVDLDIFDQVSKGLSDSLAKESKVRAAESLRENLRDTIVSAGADQAVQMSTDAQGSITLELNSGAFFKPGSADLQDQAIPVLNSIAEEIAQPLYGQFNISVEGHTDDEPINTPRFPSNWELSSGRASTVVRFLIDYKKGTDLEFSPKRLRAIGYAETQPKFANRDDAGVPLPENQMANRRVVMRVNRNQIYEGIKTPTFRRASDEAENAVKGSKGSKGSKGAKAQK